MQLDTEEIPFDVKLFSAIKFSTRNPKAYEAAKAELEKHVKQAIDPKHEVDNPVSRVLGREQSKVSAMSEVQALAATVDSLAQEIAAIKKSNDRQVNASSALAKALLGDTGFVPPTTIYEVRAHPPDGHPEKRVALQG